MNIQEALQYCATYYQPPLDMGQKQVLQSLATACGVSESVLSRVSDVDLIAIFKVARKNESSARETARRVNAKWFANEPNPWGNPTPPPPVPTPSGPSRTELDALARQVDERIKALTLNMEGSIERLTVSQKQLLVDAAKAGQKAVADAISTFKQNEPVTLQIQRPDKPLQSVGLVHRETPRILRYLQAGANVYLHGPAGSGKTTAAHKCADALDVPFYFAAKVESEYLLIGFKDAHGDTVRTQFREAYEKGGVFLFDEMDASSPSAIVALNAALANGVCPFPDGIIKRHENFYCIGAGNTVLTGANRQYTGRMQMDAASIDRFAFIEFAYDEALELELASHKGWCLHVQALRKAVAERGLSHLITPRATLDGCKLLAIGEPWDEVENAVIFKGLDADTARQLRNAVSLIGVGAA